MRLYIKESLNASKKILLNEKQTHYVRNVMRAQENDPVLIFNGTQGEWEAKIHYEGKKNIVLIVDKQTKPQQNPKPCILCFAVIKKEHTDLVLQKATELGVTEIFPMITERTVVRGFNQEHAELTIAEAAEQCERLTVPLLHPAKPMKEVLRALPSTCTPVYLAERATSSDKLTNITFPAFIIGPEGGFTPNENAYLTDLSAVTVHLGDTILRAETAAIAILSVWQFRLF